uniref:Uncharacterized protein n=1 Tax=Cacopsylla melanoneura TaxID=428564 RepID=A0A8D8W5R7_9HEMI
MYHHLSTAVSTTTQHRISDRNLSPCPCLPLRFKRVQDTSPWDSVLSGDATPPKEIWEYLSRQFSRRDKQRKMKNSEKETKSSPSTEPPWKTRRMLKPLLCSRTSRWGMLSYMWADGTA